MPTVTRSIEFVFAIYYYLLTSVLHRGALSCEFDYFMAAAESYYRGWMAAPPPQLSRANTHTQYVD